MTTVLVIQAHPHTKNSLSVTVGKKFIDTYRKNHPNDKIIIRDLYANRGVPPLNDLTMEAWRKKKFQEELAPAEEKLLTDHETWLDEFMNADKYIFINPMYNHFLPAELKQYLDLTAVAHRTFKYTAKGPVGLLKNKKVIHIQSSGSIYHQEGKWGIIKFAFKKLFHISSSQSCALMDLGSLYLVNMLKFYGINDIDSIYIEGADANPSQRENTLAAAQKMATQKAINF
ncbi:FMN-dependent NADH-azoreductase [Lactobacillus sp. PV034]|uniref:FMN-dependent NADH-azoreductase n=1 Tax=Lactobacillus sp. PV034 TaxID=2594495 RepID=UPI00223FC815|nr:NAD(P)H-dependent oxidoreductase [Lactobacillus sp. PV034]QNQ81018.1 FMN-dependent NADH-azoreductase [Lactobacillus sp. PV034]